MIAATNTAAGCTLNVLAMMRGEMKLSMIQSMTDVLITMMSI